MSGLEPGFRQSTVLGGQLAPLVRWASSLTRTRVRPLVPCRLVLRHTQVERVATGVGVATQWDVEATPVASSVESRRRMERQRRRDTGPELALRKALWARGLRYRVDYRVLPGLRRRADVAFIGPRVAVFVDGCFWHRCPDHGTTPRANREWWVRKLEGNVERDRDTDARLRDAGWFVVRVWEHEDAAVAVARVERAVRSRV